MLAATSARSAVLFALLALTAWASALTVVGEPTATGASGDYVTLGFHLSGQGTYHYEVSVPEPWQPLSKTGRVRVEGAGFVSVTMRVPRMAPADVRTAVTLTLTNAEDAADGAVGRGYVTVLATAGVELLAPRELDGVISEPLELFLLVGNRGNKPDVFSLTGSAGMWDVRFEVAEVPLNPGEEREVRVVLELRGTVTPGYRNVLIVTATSRNDPTVSARTFTESRFYEHEGGATERARTAPRLTVAVGTGVSGGLTIDEAGASASVGYFVNPRLSGELSDYVRATAGVGSFSGTVEDPFAEVPSRLDVGLSAETWDASASIGNGSYSLGGGGVVNDWRLGGSGSYAPVADGMTLGVNAFAISQVPGLDLQFSGATALTPTGRRDGLGAGYRTPLGDNLLLSVGSNVTGLQTDEGYAVVAGINESLSYQAQSFDVTQTYSGVPWAGLHNIGLNGGLRSAGPFGVRASTSLQLSAGSPDWRNVLTLSARPVAGLSLAVAGTWQTSPTSSTWSVSPRLSYSFRLDALRGNFGVRYAYTGVLRGDQATGTLYGANASVAMGPVSVGADAVYLSGGVTPAHGAGATFRGRATAEYRPGFTTRVLARYEYVSDTQKGEGSTKFGVSWSEEWARDFGTRLSYDRSHTEDYASGKNTQKERLALSAQFRNLGLDGLNLSAGYALSSQTGLLTGLAPLKHDISLRVSYTLRFSFDTPPGIVETFGGRKGGAVSGVAFLDRDLDGRRGDNEEVLAGVAVSLGGEVSITGTDGSYHLRAPSGSHTWVFGAGLPASVRSNAASVVTVEENSVQVIDLPFVPVVSLSVTLFDDLDNDGARGPDETGISFGGVIVDGPMRKEVLLDARGNAVVTDLIPGRYTVTPDPGRLPPRYRITTEPVVVVVREGERPAPVAVGAAAPPRQVVTTFEASALAVIARADKTTVAAGESLELKALVTGQADRVFARIGGVEFPLTSQGARWSGTVTVPAGTPAGPLTMEVVAEGSGESTAIGIEITVR
jgi:hypothetical protein